MVARIRLEPDLTELDLSAGETGTIKIKVTNGGNIVDQFDLSLQGLEAGWYSISPLRVSLFPQADGEVTLRLHPPAGPISLAGGYPFEFFATSRDNPDDFTTLHMQLRVTAVGEWDIDLEPKRVAAREGSFTATLRNTGNASRELVLRPSDPDEKLVFKFGSANVLRIDDMLAQQAQAEQNAQTAPGGSVPADSPDAPTRQNEIVAEGSGSIQLRSTTLEVETMGPSDEAAQGAIRFTMPAATRIDFPVTVKPKKRVWFGDRPAQFPFEIAATPPGVEWEPEEARRVQGELIYRPIFAALASMPMLLRRGLAIALPLLLLLGLGALLLRPTPPSNAETNDSIAQTQTALALSSSQTQTALALGASQTQTALALDMANANATQTALANVAASQTADALAASQTQTAIAGGGVGGNGGTPGTGNGTPGTNGTTNFPGPPIIVRYDLITAPDGGATIEWEVRDASTVTINDATVPLSGTQAIDTTTDQSYVLTASNDKGTVSQSKGILLVRPPQIQSFTADQTDVCAGCEVTFTWNVQRAERITLDGQQVQGSQGTLRIRVTESKEFILSAENVLGKDIRTVTVNVNPNITPTAAPPL